MRIYGLMVSRSDHWILKRWLDSYGDQFVRLVVLDGTTNALVANKIRNITSFYSNVVYVHEGHFKGDARLEGKTDNGLRSLAWEFLDKKEVLGQWVVIAHADEFYLDAFTDMASLAERRGANVVQMEIIYAVPYINDKANLEQGTSLGPDSFDIVKRVRYCVKNYHWVEDRMFKYVSGHVKWGNAKSKVIPQYFPGIRKADFRGVMVHYKIHNFEPGFINESTGTFVDSSWSGIPSFEINNRKNGLMYSIINENEGSLIAAEVNQTCYSNRRATYWARYSCGKAHILF